MELKIFNGTNHQIHLYDVKNIVPSQSGLIKIAGSTPTLVIPSGQALNCVRGSRKNYPQPPIKGTIIFTEDDSYPQNHDIVVAANLLTSWWSAIALQPSSRS